MHANENIEKKIKNPLSSFALIAKNNIFCQYGFFKKPGCFSAQFTGMQILCGCHRRHYRRCGIII